MKRLILIIFFGLLSAISFSQSLAGDWEGVFETTKPEPYMGHAEFTATSIKLQFIVNKDSSYTVFSYTRGLEHHGHDTTVICKVTGEFGKDSVYLREVTVVLPANYPSTCLMEMFLKISRNKKDVELRGVWVSVGDNCDSSGLIYFFKKES